MKKQTPESKVLRGCLNYLRARGIMHWRNTTGAIRAQSGHWLRYGKKGSSDIIGVMPDGRALFVECKAPDGRLSPEQREFLDEARRSGALCVLAKDWAELDQAILDAGYKDEKMILFNEGEA